MNTRQVSYHRAMRRVFKRLFETNPKTELESFFSQSPKLPGFIEVWLQVSQENTSSLALLIILAQGFLIVVDRIQFCQVGEEIKVTDI